MATRTISSPGVQINEVDLSVVARTPAGTNVFVTGFAPQGPTNEIINVGSISEFEDVFGTPTNAAERYLYHSARQLLTQSPANLLVTRMPYGSGAGAGFSNQYTALVYPISADSTKFSTASGFRVLPPTSVLLSDQQYQDLLENNVTWSETVNTSSSVSITTYDDIVSKGGIVVLDSNKTSVNNLYEGYYIGLADNSDNNPATDFTAITGIKASNAISTNGNFQTFVDVPSSRLTLTLTQSYSSAGTSVSYLIESFPRSLDFGQKVYNDCLTLLVYKINTSIYAQDTVVLEPTVVEGYTGSLNGLRTQNSERGGQPVSFALENIVNQSSSKIKVVVNPYFSNSGTWTNSDGTPARNVRVDNRAKNLYSEGVYIPDNSAVSGDVGNVPLKLQRILNNVDNLDLDLDVTVEAGLGTIWTGAKARWADSDYGNSSAGQPYIFDETYNVDISVLKTQTNDPVGGIANDYSDIANQFISFADNTRKDHIFIADPLRYIFVQGQNNKVNKSQSYVFASDVYWPLKNLYAGDVSSYAATYGNWLKTNDVWSNKQVWVPASGWVAATIATSSQNTYPWIAPAGFNRASLTNVIDVGVTPTQKQRDILYKINVNPIAFFPGDGFVVFGQKTLYTKPSAFDRINVRRLFLTLEKTTKSLLKFYVFEPNTFTTRTRLANALKPIFDSAKANDGLFDYKIVCDERNNTPDVIDNNELRVAIYIQPVRAAEFILADFVATRTGVDLNEVIG